MPGEADILNAQIDALARNLKRIVSAVSSPQIVESYAGPVRGPA